MSSARSSRWVLANTLSYLDNLMREVERVSLVAAWLIGDLADDTPRDDVLAEEVELLEELYGFLRTYDV